MNLSLDETNKHDTTAPSAKMAGKVFLEQNQKNPMCEPRQEGVTNAAKPAVLASK